MPKRSTTKDQIKAMQSLTQGAAAWLVGVGERHLRTTDAPRNADGTYCGVDLARWLTERAADDVADTGTESPNLERYRAAKADLTEMLAAERRGQLIPREASRDFLGRVAAIICQAGQVIKTFSTEAHAILDEALADAETAVEEFFE